LNSIRQHPDQVKEAFRDWCAVPSKDRQPASLNEWCELYDVERTTTWRWRQDPVFRQAVAERVKAAILPRLPDMLEVAVQKALEGSYRHLELLIRHIAEIWHIGPEEKETPSQAGEGLLQAMQSGRLGQQLAAMVMAGREALKKEEALKEKGENEIEANYKLEP